MYDDATLNILLDLRTLDALSELPKEAKIIAFVKVGMATEFPYNLRPDEKRRLPMKLDGANVSTRSVQVLMDLVAKGDVSGRRRTPEQEKADEERLARQRDVEAERLRRKADKEALLQAEREAKRIAIADDFSRMRKAGDTMEGFKADVAALAEKQKTAASATAARGFTAEATGLVDRATLLYTETVTSVDRRDYSTGDKSNASTLGSTLDSFIRDMRAVTVLMGAYEFIGSLRNSLASKDATQLKAEYASLDLNKRIRYLTSGSISGTLRTSSDVASDNYFTLLENWIARAVLAKADLGDPDKKEEYIALFPVTPLTFARDKIPFRTNANAIYELRTFTAAKGSNWARNNPVAEEIVRFLENMSKK